MGIFQQPIRVRARVSGRVQGVFFRAETRARAEELHVTGWVRNLPDGRVELVAEGEEQNVRALVDWCRTGPPHARVERVEEFQENAAGEFESFSITY